MVPLKNVLICMILLPVFLCGCASTKTAVPILDGIGFTAEVAFYNENYKCNVDINGNIIDLTVTSPEELKGLILHYSDNGLTAEYLGITYTPDDFDMTIGGVSSLMSGIINDVRGEDCNMDYDNGNCIITDKYMDFKYEFVFSPSGLPISLSVPNKSFEAVFKNVTIK